jgi:hypothetical protein
VFFRVSQQEADALSHFAHFNQNARWPCFLTRLRLSTASGHNPHFVFLAGVSDPIRSELLSETTRIF